MKQLLLKILKLFSLLKENNNVLEFIATFIFPIANISLYKGHSMSTGLESPTRRPSILKKLIQDA